MLLETCVFDISQILKIDSGEKYTAVLLKNGNIGVCANLGHKAVIDISGYENLDLSDSSTTYCF